MPPRIPTPIGKWTALKLEYLGHYLQAYVTATKRAGARYYIDAFAGCGDCVVRETGFPADGSPWRALRTIPPFTTYFFVERNRYLANHLAQRLKDEGVGNASVYVGDCNEVIPRQVMKDLPRTAPSFCFLDPTGLQLHWETVRSLAGHRTGDRKMELLILYPYDMAINPRLFNEAVYPALKRFFGGDYWLDEFRRSQKLGESGSKRRERFVNLYQRLLRGLGYRYVEAFGPLRDGRRFLYHVVFASDHHVGAKIMHDVWSRPRAIPGQLDYSPVRRPRPRE